MTLTWSPQALQDLRDIRAYISQEDSDAAKKIVARIVSLVGEQLPLNPKIGRHGRVAGTRELMISSTPFNVPYLIRGDHIEVLRVYHRARMWPETF